MELAEVENWISIFRFQKMLFQKKIVSYRNQLNSSSLLIKRLTNTKRNTFDVFTTIITQKINQP